MAWASREARGEARFVRWSGDCRGRGHERNVRCASKGGKGASGVGVLGGWDGNGTKPRLTRSTGLYGARCLTIGKLSTE